MVVPFFEPFFSWHPARVNDKTVKLELHHSSCDARTVSHEYFTSPYEMVTLL